MGEEEKSKEPFIAARNFWKTMAAHFEANILNKEDFRLVQRVTHDLKGEIRPHAYYFPESIKARIRAVLADSATYEPYIQYFYKVGNPGSIPPPPLPADKKQILIDLYRDACDYIPDILK